VNRNRQIIIYLFTYFFNAAISFVIVSLLTNRLSTEDYGIINLYSGSLIFLTPFITGGILYPLSVEFFKRKGNEYSEYFTNAQAIPVISVVLFTILCILLQQPLSHFLKVPPVWIWILPITAWFIMVNETAQIITRNNDKPYQFAFFSIGKNLTEIAFTLLFIIVLHWAWQGRILAAAIAPALLGIFSIYLFRRWHLIAKKIDWKIARQILWLSLPFIIERLTVFTLGYSDRYFIDHYDPNKTKAVGLYGLGSQFGTIIFLLIGSLNSAYQPYLFKKMSEGFKGKIHKATMWYVLACLGTVAAMCLAIPFLFKWFIGKEYQDAKIFAYILCGGYTMWGVYNAFQAYLIYLNRSRIIFMISLIGMLTSLVLNFILVPKMGAKGAAITSVVTYSVMAITCYLFVYKYVIVKKTLVA